MRWLNPQKAIVMQRRTRRLWSTPALKYPQSQAYWQITYGCMQSSAVQPLTVSCPELYYARSVVPLRWGFPGAVHAACLNSCPVVTRAAQSNTPHCSLVQLETNRHEICMLSSNLEQSVNFESLILTLWWEREPAPGGHPSPITLRFLCERKERSTSERIPQCHSLSLTPNWKPYKASDVLTNAIYEPLNWCQRNPLLFDLIISLFLARRLRRLWLLLTLAQQKCGHPARLLDSISRLLVSNCRPLYYILPLIWYLHFH